MTKILQSAAVLLLLSILNSQLPTVFAQGTAFTYQGQLISGGSPASGSYDLTFTLYTTNVTGSAVAGPVTNNATVVTNGLFVVLVDFGPGVFVGTNNWLEIAVRTNEGSAFTTLAPRQLVTPTPYALVAGSANNLAGLSVQQNTNGAPNLIGGAGVNYVVSSVVGATVSGGGADDFEGAAYSNSVTGNFGTVGGGYANIVGGTASTVGGGSGNTATGLTSDTVGGGSGNSATGIRGSTIGGGQNNNVSDGYDGTVGGGYGNMAGASYATIPGGYLNIATGADSLAAGQQAQATNQGAFVWADSQNMPFASTKNDSFNVRAQGGVNFVTGGTGITVDGPIMGTGPSTLPGMSVIPAGSFTMGDNLDGESDALTTNVYVSAFYVDVNLVSYAQWQSLYFWATNQGYSFVHAGAGKAANQPVQTVDWYDSVKWCNARSQQSGLIPMYYTDAGLTQVYTNGEVAPFVNWSANGYRLPTEAEWEKAARGGLGGQRFPWGNVITEYLANYYGDTPSYSYDLGPNGYNAASTNGVEPYTSPVGYFAANGYGLYDMAGNVGEWCWDWYGTPYGQPTTTNPTGPASGFARVVRGGEWGDYAGGSRCAHRYSDFEPNEPGNLTGFRCVRGL